MQMQTFAIANEPGLVPALPLSFDGSDVKDNFKPPPPHEEHEPGEEVPEEENGG